MAGTILFLQVIVCFLLRYAVSDCPPYLSSTTTDIQVNGQQTTLEDALLSLQTTASGNCAQLRLSAGSVHYLTQRIHALQSVVLQRHPAGSYNDSKPVIRCADGMPGAKDVDNDDDEQLSATVSFSNVSYVEISDIVFEYCPLPLQFKNVTSVRVAKSNFR